MHKFYYSQKDNFISSISASDNYGKDQILELHKTYNDPYSGSISYGITRILTKFDLNPLSQSLAKGEIPDNNNTKYFLRLYNVESSGVSSGFILQAHPLSQSWNEGPGRKSSSPPETIYGSSWNYPESSLVPASSWSIDDEASSGSFNPSGPVGVLLGGGAYYSSSMYICSQSFSDTDKNFDINMDISHVVRKQIKNPDAADQKVSASISIPNHGMIIKFFPTDESNYERHSLKFFSRNTNTIYAPKLEVRWDDHIGPPNYTSSFTALDMTGEVDNHVYVKGIKPRYKETETVKFRVGARKKYVGKTFSTSVQTISSSYIADTSGSYSIKDVATGETIIPFGDYSLLSLDSGSMYFNQDLNGFDANRIYKILVKVKYNDGQEVIYDNDSEFKVVR